MHDGPGAGAGNALSATDGDAAVGYCTCTITNGSSHKNSAPTLPAAATGIAIANMEEGIETNDSKEDKPCRIVAGTACSTIAIFQSDQHEETCDAARLGIGASCVIAGWNHKDF